MITHFKDENRKSEKKYNNYKILSTLLETFDTFTIATTSTSVTLSVTGFGFIVLLISTGSACGLILSDEFSMK